MIGLSKALIDECLHVERERNERDEKKYPNETRKILGEW
jgi:hypothetical protein